MAEGPQVISLLDFLAQPDEQVPFIVEPFFPAGGVCYLHGKGGGGKSFLANAMLKSVADGTPFLGKFPTAQGKVIYIQNDMQPVTNRVRMRKVVTVVAHPENVMLLQFEGKFDVVEEVQKMAPWIAQVREAEAALVIVDTVKKSTRMDENSNDTPSEYYGIWKKIVGPAALLFIAHDNKDASMDTRGDDDRARGAHAWLDDADCAIRQMMNKKTKAIKIRWSKVRTCEEDAVPEMRLVIDDDTQMVVVDAEEGTVEKFYAQYANVLSNTQMARQLKGVTGLSERTLMRRLEKLRPNGKNEGVSRVTLRDIPRLEVK